MFHPALLCAEARRIAYRRHVLSVAGLGMMAVLCGCAGKPAAPSSNLMAPTITWATPASINYGTALSATQLDATASVAGSFVYSPSSGVLTAGSQPLSVTFTPTDTAVYSTANAAVTLIVNQGVPTLTWATPAAISVATALGNTQLDASASVAGTFSYSPAAGSTFSSAGTQTLTATFTPQDATDYTTASATVPIVVGRTFYVSVTGSDSAGGQTISTPFRTLQKAANSTAPGDFVYVMNGTYTNDNDNYVLVGISTAGTPNAWINYQAYTGATPLLQGNNYTWDVVRFTNTAAYISLSGFTVIGNDANVTLAQAQAVESDPANHPEVNGNCISVDGQDRTSAIYPHHVKILNNTAASCPGGGISTTDADYITIAGNTVYDDSWYSAYGTSAISTLSSFDTDAADTATQYKMVIAGNVIYGSQEFIPWLNYKPPTITDGEGIIIDSNKNSAYPGGGNTNPPYAGRTLIANNVIYSNGSAGIEVFQSAHVDVVNNSTYADVITPVESGRGEMNLNVASDVNIVNNVFYSGAGQNPVTMNNACTGGCSIDYNQYFGGTNTLSGIAAGAHDQTGDPLYVAPTAASPGAVSLKLQAGSPAIASGTSTLAPATDINGKPRPATGVDRGAYQQ